MHQELFPWSSISTFEFLEGVERVTTLTRFVTLGVFSFALPKKTCLLEFVGTTESGQFAEAILEVRGATCASCENGADASHPVRVGWIPQTRTPGPIIFRVAMLRVAQETWLPH